eukprot:6196069-Amphidinium_carterae.1
MATALDTLQATPYSLQAPSSQNLVGWHSWLDLGVDIARQKPRISIMQAGDRVRIQGGKNFEKFHGGMEVVAIESRPRGSSSEVPLIQAGNQSLVQP